MSQSTEVAEPSTLSAISQGWDPVTRSWEQYNQKVLQNAPDSSGIGQTIVSSRDIIHGRYNTIVESLGKPFAAGEDLFRKTMTDIEEQHLRKVDGAIRYQLTKRSMVPNFVQSGSEWTKEAQQSLSTAVDRTIDALQDMATRMGYRPVDHQSNVVFQPYEEGVAMEDSSIPYCTGAVLLQTFKTNFTDTVLPPEMQQCYTCKYCYLEVSDYQTAALKYTDEDWTQLAKCHILACPSLFSDRRAAFRCHFCFAAGLDQVIVSASSMFFHLQSCPQLAENLEDPDPLVQMSPEDDKESWHSHAPSHLGGLAQQQSPTTPSPTRQRGNSQPVSPLPPSMPVRPAPITTVQISQANTAPQKQPELEKIKTAKGSIGQVTYVPSQQTPNAIPGGFPTSEIHNSNIDRPVVPLRPKKSGPNSKPPTPPSSTAFAPPAASPFTPTHQASSRSSDQYSHTSQSITPTQPSTLAWPYSNPGKVIFMPKQPQRAPPQPPRPNSESNPFQATPEAASSSPPQINPLRTRSYYPYPVPSHIPQQPQQQPQQTFYPPPNPHTQPQPQQPQIPPTIQTLLDFGIPSPTQAKHYLDLSEGDIQGAVNLYHDQEQHQQDRYQYQSPFAATPAATAQQQSAYAANGAETGPPRLSRDADREREKERDRDNASLRSVASADGKSSIGGNSVREGGKGDKPRRRGFFG